MAAALSDFARSLTVETAFSVLAVAKALRRQSQGPLFNVRLHQGV